jgi:predicted ATP-dependent endonuclease of OLD family
MKGQVICTSHSADSISHTPIENLRRIYKKHGDTLVGMIEANLLSDNEK